MKRALIIEDEKLAAEHLQKLIGQCDRDIEVIDTLDSIKGAIGWFTENSPPDLVFMDIQLSDGLSFDIFNHIQMSCPVIFTTAYEEYALRAFKVNSIDYLLKPINLEDISYAIDQFESQIKPATRLEDQSLKYKVDMMMQTLTNNYKTRFVVNAGVHIQSIEVENIVCFYSLEKATFLQEETGRIFDINYSIDQLETLVDPKLFFRINRKYLANIKAIKDIIAYSGSKLKIKLANTDDNEIFVSRKRMKDFKQWLNR
jgi:DNA-binding LytR/AlgR family response regulator